MRHIDELVLGLQWGAAAAVIGLSAALVMRRRGTLTPLPIGGFLLAAGALLALDQIKKGVPLALVVAAALAGVAGAVPLPRLPLAVRAVLRVAVLVGAAALVGWGTELRGPDWLPAAVAAAAVLAGVSAGDLDRRLGTRGAAPALVLVAVTATGIFATTPDTEHALAFLGAALAVMVLAWPFPFVRLGNGGAWAVAVVVMWVAAVDGRERPGALVGAMACWGLLLVEPVGRALAWRGVGAADLVARLRPALLVTPLLAAAHLGLVIWCSRVAGLETSASTAASLAATLLGPATVVLAGLAWVAGRQR